MAQVAEFFPGMGEAFGSIPSTTRNQFKSKLPSDPDIPGFIPEGNQSQHAIKIPAHYVLLWHCSQ
jgi:hypothetical protein